MHIKGFIKYLQFERRASQDTLQAYQSDLGQCASFLRAQYDIKKIEEAQARHLRSWLVALLKDRMARTTVKRKHSTLKSYFNYLHKYHNLKANPMLKVPAPKIGQRLPVFLAERETQNLFERLEWGPDFPAQRDRLILLLFYTAGIRRAELIRLRWQDIDWQGPYLKVLGKGNKERLIPFGAQLAKALQEYQVLCKETFGEMTSEQALLLTDKGKPLYPKLVYNKVRSYLQQVSQELKLSPHVLRHTFATHLSNNGADLNAIKELLGHSSLAATQVYTHNTIEQLKEIYKQAHPKAKSDQ